MTSKTNGSGGGQTFSGCQSNLSAWMTPETSAADQVAAAGGEGSSSQKEHKKGNASDERHPRQHRASPDPAPLSELTSGAPVELASLATGDDKSAAGRSGGGGGCKMGLRQQSKVLLSVGLLALSFELEKPRDSICAPLAARSSES